MRPALLKPTLRRMIELGRPTAIEGPPGGGKTSIVRGVSKDMGLPVIELHMPTMLVEDFGIPYPNPDDEEFGYKLPNWFPYRGKPGTESGGVLLFDDRNQAGGDLQKVFANIQQARTLHGVPLADNWAIVSTGNRQQDRAGANKILGHLRNRETVIELDTHLDDSIHWMMDNEVKPQVIAFLRFRPELLHEYKPERDANPTPRSWVEGVSKVLGEVPREAEYECFKGAVGEGAASEFESFMRVYRELPDIDLVLANPKTAEVPTEPSTLYAMIGAMVSRINRDNFDNAVTYVGRVPPEFAVLCVSYVMRKNPELASTATFTKWVAKYDSLL